MIKRIRAAFKAFKNPDLIKETGRDFLTGALSRKAFINASKREFKRATREGYSLALVFIDLDGLKEVNDKCGHAKGDRYLKKFAKAALKHIRSFELLARWGGDEFVLLLSADEENARQIVCRIYNSFPNFSWGVSIWESGERENFYLTLKKADEKMYEMKKNRVK